MTHITPPGLAKHIAADRRSRILELLKQAPGAVMNENVLQRALRVMGHLPTVCMLRDDLMVLADRQRITLETGEPWVAGLCLTMRCNCVKCPCEMGASV